MGPAMETGAVAEGREPLHSRPKNKKTLFLLVFGTVNPFDDVIGVWNAILMV